MPQWISFRKRYHSNKVIPSSAIWMCSFLNPHVSKSKTWLVPKPVSNFSRTKYNIQTPLNADTSLLRTKESPYIFSYINIIQTAYADTPFIGTLTKAPTMSVWTWLIRTYQQLTCTYINTNQVLNSSHQWNGSYWQRAKEILWQSFDSFSYDQYQLILSYTYTTETNQIIFLIWVNVIQNNIQFLSCFYNYFKTD